MSESSEGTSDAESVDSEDSEADDQEEEKRVKQQRSMISSVKPVSIASLIETLQGHWDSQDLGPMPTHVASALAACGGESVSPELCAIRMGNVYAEMWGKEALSLERKSLYPTK